jgi:hypothetical protein
MIDDKRQYLSYLLRLWQERATLPAKDKATGGRRTKLVPPLSAEKGGRWRASLENSHTGERLGFANIMQLFAFLSKQVADEGPRTEGVGPEPAKEGDEWTEIARAVPHPPESRTANLAPGGGGRPDDPSYPDQNPTK